MIIDFGRGRELDIGAAADHIGLSFHALVQLLLCSETRLYLDCFFICLLSVQASRHLTLCFRLNTPMTAITICKFLMKSGGSQVHVVVVTVQSIQLFNVSLFEN